MSITKEPFGQTASGEAADLYTLTNDAGVFLYEIPGPNGKATSFLWVRPAPVVKAGDPHRRFEVALVIERPE